jgi:hypothetical protein
MPHLGKSGNHEQTETFANSKKETSSRTKPGLKLPETWRMFSGNKTLIVSSK